ncbi:ATP-binding cassette domain-containing protein [Streptomyces sp. F63]|uniref:ABC transporter ATP-binding protein n=1 Tax=Streptomyces sp. F63 TaxID=2824887 RepID=UPI001B382C52|nr:ABC transporter ATP-binding protein [Streptomyces sp. F63]MBQ0984577.1 ATP-binding cassette domain-containing protein [Streptomyces sp. F63]
MPPPTDSAAALTAPAAPAALTEPQTPQDGPEAVERAGEPPAPRRSTVRTLLRLWPYVRPVRARLFTAAGVAVTASCLGLVIPLVLKWMVDGPVAAGDPGGVWLGGGLLFLLGITEAGLFGLRRWLVARPLAGVEAAMRANLYRRLQRLPVAFHDRWPSGQLLSRATTDLQLLRMFLAFPLTFLLVNSVTILAGCAILLSQEWTLGLVLLAPVLPLVVLCSLFEARYSLAARTARDQVGDLTTVVEEGVLGIRVIKGFGRHRSQARAFRELSDRLRGTELYKARLLAGLLAVIVTLPELALGAALVLGTVQVSEGTLSAGTLVAFLSTALALRWPVESIGFLLAMSQDSATATERHFEVVDTPLPEDTAGPEGAAAVSAGSDGRPGDGPGPVSSPVPGPEKSPASAESAPSGEARAAETPPAAPGGPGPAVRQEPEQRSRAGAPTPAPSSAPARASTATATATATADGLRFENVEFRYPDAPAGAPATLRGVDLHIRPGETMALVGATGSGKTTLTALVPRLYEVTGGRITLDGTDIARLPRTRLRELIAVAFEDPTLFSATVGENVLMGADGAGEEQLNRALAVAQAEFAHALPHGVRTQVGEQGLSLSGGQRQRLALARAVVGDPRFLVLDDPLSALDVHTEALVEAALRRILSGTTALVVAHRPSTVLLADRVALLSGGRITAVGTHRDLLRREPEYRTLMSGDPAGGPPEHAPGKGSPHGGAHSGAPSSAPTGAVPTHRGPAGADGGTHR